MVTDRSGDAESWRRRGGLGRLRNAAKSGVTGNGNPGWSGALVDVVLIVIFGCALWFARSWPATVLLFPVVVGTAGAVLSMMKLIVDVRRRRLLEGRLTRGTEGEEAERPEGLAQESQASARENVVGLGVLAMFLGVVVTLGFAIGGAVASVVYLRLVRRAGWLQSVLIGACVFAVVGGLFGALLHMSLPAGLVLEAL